MSDLKGFGLLERRLMELGNPKVIKKIAKAAIVAGQRVVVKGIKTAIPSRYKDARRTVGQSAKRVKHGETAGSVSAKVGMGVGKKMPGREAAEATRATRKAAGKRGVGISARNIHWLVLGTKHMRNTPPLKSAVKSGLAASEQEASAKIKQNLAAGIQREATRNWPDV